MINNVNATMIKLLANNGIHDKALKINPPKLIKNGRTIETNKMINTVIFIMSIIILLLKLKLPNSIQPIILIQGKLLLLNYKCSLQNWLHL